MNYVIIFNWTSQFFIEGMSDIFFHILFQIKSFEQTADSDQTPRSEASDLDLHWLSLFVFA